MRRKTHTLPRRRRCSNTDSRSRATRSTLRDSTPQGSIPRDSIQRERTRNRNTQAHSTERLGCHTELSRRSNTSRTLVSSIQSSILNRHRRLSESSCPAGLSSGIKIAYWHAFWSRSGDQREFLHGNGQRMSTNTCI